MVIKLNDTTFVSGSSDQTLRLWNLNNNTYTSRVINGHTNNVFSVMKLNDTTVISGSDDEPDPLPEPFPFGVLVQENVGDIETPEHTAGIGLLWSRVRRVRWRLNGRCFLPFLLEPNRARTVRSMERPR